MYCSYSVKVLSDVLEHSLNICPKELIIALGAKQHSLAQVNQCPQEQNQGNVPGETGQVCPEAQKSLTVLLTHLL